MKKNILFRVVCLLIMAVAVSVETFAQIGEPRNQLTVGVSGGVAINTVDFDPTIKQKTHIAPTFGVALKYLSEKYFTTYCALYAEMNYTVLGWEEDIRDQNSNPLPDTYRRNLGYLQIPIFARLSWGKEQRGMQFFFQVGPQVGFCISDSKKQSSTWTLNSQGYPSRPNNVYEQYNLDIEHKFDYGIAGGLGLEYNSKAGHFILEGRYYYGLGDMFGNSKKDPFSRSANGTIFVKLGYMMDWKKKDKAE